MIAQDHYQRTPHLFPKDFRLAENLVTPAHPTAAHAWGLYAGQPMYHITDVVNGTRYMAAEPIVLNTFRATAVWGGDTAHSYAELIASPTIDHTSSGGVIITPVADKVAYALQLAELGANNVASFNLLNKVANALKALITHHIAAPFSADLQALLDSVIAILREHNEWVRETERTARAERKEAESAEQAAHEAYLARTKGWGGNRDDFGYEAPPRGMVTR